MKFVIEDAKERLKRLKGRRNEYGYPRKEECLKHDGGSTHGRSSLHSYIARSCRMIRT